MGTQRTDARGGPAPEIIVAGEALVDLFPTGDGPFPDFRARPGGSPLNVAVGLSRLGIRTAFLGKLSTDPFGRWLRQYLRENGVDLSLAVEGPQPTGLAFVIPGEEGEPGFRFYGADTADAALTPGEVPSQLPRAAKLLHLGSLAMVREPSATTLSRLMEREGPRRLISFDPNIRADQIRDPGEYRERFAGWLRWIDVLKLSRDDLSFLAPGTTELEAVRRWLPHGPKVIVITHGPSGARAYTPSLRAEVEAPRVAVADTVGAGDAFTAGLLAALRRLGKLTKAGIADIDEGTMVRALRFAVGAAAVVCTRIGADPPWRREMDGP